MAYKTRAEALDSIRVRVRKNGKRLYDAYLGTNPITKEVKRMFGNRREELEERINEFYRYASKVGVVGAILTPIQSMDAKSAYDALAKAGVQLSLLECAKRVVGQISASAPKSSMTLDEAYSRFLEEKTCETSDNNIKSIKSRIGKWVELFGKSRTMDEVTEDSVRQYLNENYGEMSKTTYNGQLQYLNIFLNWCVEKPQRYLAENPIEGLKKKKVEWSEPECITPTDARILFAALEKAKGEFPHYLAYAILSFFCGIRREEILRIAGAKERNDMGNTPAAMINLETGMIRILKPKGFLKGVAPRAFEIPETALKWMKSFDFLSAIPDIGESTVKCVYEIGRANGAKIPKNCGRHSFITHHVVAYGNLQKTLLIAGTGEAMAEDHYRALRSQREGLEYFSILPSPQVGGQVG